MLLLYSRAWTNYPGASDITMHRYIPGRGWSRCHSSSTSRSGWMMEISPLFPSDKRPYIEEAMSTLAHTFGAPVILGRCFMGWQQRLPADAIPQQPRE
eukprot:scaffold413994_cov20-Prasinocladus_malaysianus.AAC.1